MKLNMEDERKIEPADRQLGDLWRDWKGEPTASKSTGSPALHSFLIVVCYLLLCASAAGAYYMVSPRLMVWSPHVATAALIGISALATLLGLFILTVLLSLWLQRDLLAFLPFSKRQAFLMALFPFCKKIGAFIGLFGDTVSASMVAFNNRLILGLSRRAAGRRLLVILPRCLQNFYCQQNVIEDVSNCRSCGKCDIARLVGLMEEHRFHMAVATGGRLARRLVHDFRPAGIIAVACERELLDGLRDFSQIPVWGITNARPEGPCRNTIIDLNEFEATLKSILPADR